MTELMTRPSIALLTAIALLVTACSSGGGVGDVESGLEEQLGASLSPAEIADVVCPEDADLTQGSTFVCSLTVDDQPLDMQVVMVTDEEWDANPVQAVIDMVRFEQAASDEAGVDLTVDCGQSQALIAEVGAVLRCPVTGAFERHRRAHHGARRDGQC